MKRSSQFPFFMAVLFALMFSLVIQLSVASAAETTTLRFAGWHPIGHHCTRGQELYAKLVMEKTNKVKIEVYPAAQLFSDKDMVRALSTGAVDMGVMATGAATGAIPALLFNDIPFTFKDRAHFHRLIDSEVGEILKQEFEKKGYHFVYWMDFGAFGFASKMPLKTLEDFKGKRIRGPGEMMVEGIRALGASPTFLGSGEVYMALQRNTIDGAISGWTTFFERKYYETTKYLTDAEYVIGTMGILMNKKVWEGLPEDVQTIMMAAAKEAQAWGRKECEKMDHEDLEQLKKKGMQYYYVPEKERDRWKAATTKVCTELFMKRIDDPQKGKRMLEIAEKLR